MLYLAPSILSADFSRLGEEVSLVEKSGLKMLHIDVMDGNFVPNISFGVPIIKSIREKSNLEFDVHLMIQSPERFINEFSDAGADMITIHAESCQHLHRVVHQVKEAGKKCCVALNPATPLTVLEYLYTDLDMILIMTVNPGFGGQKYIPQMTNKIIALKRELELRNLHIPIEVDGGINQQNVIQVAEAGANVFVAGASVFGKHTAENIAEFKKIFDTYRA